MPKKRHSNLKRLEGTSQGNHHSSQSGQHSDKNGKTESVNERLRELRLAEPAEALQRKREIADRIAGPSVPPTLNDILGVPSSAPPRARQGVRSRIFTRTPGPAPPSSWLTGDQHGESTSVDGTLKDTSIVPTQALDVFLRFQHLAHEDEVQEQKNTASLSHMCLKLLASNLHAIEDTDIDILLDLPSQVRMRLLSYLALYGSTLSNKAFTTLIAGQDPIHELNLSGLIGHRGLPVTRLTTILRNDLQLQRNDGDDSVVDSWDTGADTGLSATLYASRFAQLTHLSLSHPPSSVLWRDLLSLTKQTPRLTHLSLAHWPRPTLTPNLSTTTIKHDRGPDVVAGGSHFYSEYDNDLAEPISLLRQLSGNLSDLKWLDVEGCDRWTDALYKVLPAPSVRTGREWAHRSSQPLLSSAMRGVSYIRLAGDHLPIDQIDRLTPGVVIISGWSVTSKMMALLEVVQRLRASDTAQAVALRKWCQRAINYHSDAEAIQTMRRSEKCLPLTLDYGWTKINA